MDIDIVQRILDESRDLATLPQVMTEVLRLARDEDSTVGQLARVLERDPTLAADVLRLVNSPYFGRRERIGSVHEAVVRLGLKNILAVALSASVYDMTANWQSALDRKRFWRHSLETAIAARMVANVVGYRQAEEVFVAGMLHDLGMLAVEKAYPMQFAHVWVEARHEGNLRSVEQRQWGADHAQIGRFLLERWNLPASICHAVGWHHSYQLPDEVTEEIKPALIVRMGHMISKFAVSVEQRVTTTQLFFKEDLRRLLDISPLDLQRVERELFTQTMKEAEYLEMDVGSADEIMLETQQLLFEQYITIENLAEELKAMQDDKEAAKVAVMN